jgi:hypothetical protein
MDEGTREFLPPQPAGPEPELGRRPAPAPPPPLPPSDAGWQQPAPPTWGQAPQPAQPDNGPAVAGFVLSIVSGGLLVITLGLSTIVSLACAILGLVYSGRGKRKVESGETSKNASLANAGWVISIVSLVLSAIATILYILLVIALATDDQFRRDFENEFDNSNTIRAFVRVAVALVT